MKRSIRLFITGSIQPVLFNRFIKENADKLRVKGFVRNLEDGRAEIFMEGNPDAVEQMNQVCRRGPMHSQFREIEQKEDRYQGFDDFRILRI